MVDGNQRLFRKIEANQCSVTSLSPVHLMLRPIRGRLLRPVESSSRMCGACYKQDPAHHTHISSTGARLDARREAGHQIRVNLS